MALRRGVMALGLACIVVLGAADTGSAALAATGRDEVRLNLLDSCVMTETARRQVKDKIADECKCASARASQSFSTAQVSAFKGKLASDTKSLWNQATRACFKSSTTSG